MNNWGIAIAFLTTLSWTIGIFPFTQASVKLGANEVNHFRLLLSSVLLGLILILSSGISPMELFTQPNTEHWLWLGLSGIIGLSIGDYFSFSAFSYLGARMGSIFATLSPGAALLSALLLLNESINTTGIIAMVITVAGLAIVLMDKKDTVNTKGSNYTKGMLFGFLSAMCQGLGLVMARKGLTEYGQLNPVHATFIRMSVATLILYSITIATGRLKTINKPILSNQNNGLKYLVMGTLFGPVIGVSLSLYTVSIIEASVAQTIFSLVPAFATIIALFFYKEKIGFKGYLGLFISLTGVILLIWRNKF